MVVLFLVMTLPVVVYLSFVTGPNGRPIIDWSAILDPEHVVRVPLRSTSSSKLTLRGWAQREWFRDFPFKRVAESVPSPKIEL